MIVSKNMKERRQLLSFFDRKRGIYMSNFDPFRDAKLLEEQEEKEKQMKELKEQEGGTLTNNNGRIAVELKIEDLIPSKKNIFHKYTEDERKNLKESIERIGLQYPIIVRKVKDSINNKYEILSGENRTEVFKELGKETIPAFIVEADDDTAELILIDSNIVQRQKMSVMERAKIYNQKYIIEKRKKYDKQAVEENLTEVEQKILGQNIARQTYYRYLSLNDLIPELQEMCDKEEIQVTVGEQLSKLPKNNQKELLKYLENNKINESKATKLKQLAINTPEEFNESNISNIISGNRFNNEVKIGPIKFSKDELKKYFSECKTTEEVKEKIIKILEKL